MVRIVTNQVSAGEHWWGPSTEGPLFTELMMDSGNLRKSTKLSLSTKITLLNLG